MVFNVPRFDDLEQDYVHQENVEYEQFAVGGLLVCEREPKL